MTSLIEKKLDWLHSSNLEIDLEHEGSYYEIMNELKKRHDYKFYSIIGTDNANDIGERKWIESERLITENPFIVIEREGHPPKYDWYLKEHHRFLNVDANDASASEVREAIKRRDLKFAKENIHPEVWRYIKDNRLYGLN